MDIGMSLTLFKKWNLIPLLYFLDRLLENNCLKNKSTKNPHLILESSHSVTRKILIFQQLISTVSTYLYRDN